MIKTVYPSLVNGKVAAPASKSFFQRAVALAILANGKTEVENLSDCDDCLAAVDIAKRFGCTTSLAGDILTIESHNRVTPQELFCGEAGLGLRMFTPLAALQQQPITLTGHGSLLKRPVNFMEPSLAQLGVKVQTQNGLPPITVCGPLQGGKATVDGTLSSQFLTGLLIALPLAKTDTELEVIDLTSIPYIDMTLQAIKDFGGVVEHHQYKTFYIKGNQHYTPCRYFVEGDWSGAAGTLIAGAIGGKSVITILNTNSTQADKAVLDALKQTGAGISISGHEVEITKPSQLQAFTLDATQCPDLFPVLVALAANCHGTTHIKGIHRLTHKESNRALALKQEFNKLGLSIDLHDDMMIIKGGTIQGGNVSAHNDHRMAMSMALAALNAKGPVMIEGAESVAKSYPQFFSDMAVLGVRVD
jgi:3-phosphoshikimate 1-carboxyvinyltransferase